MRYASQIRRTLGVLSVAIVASTSAYAAGPVSPSAAAGATASQTNILTPALISPKAGESAANNLHLIDRRGRGGYGRRGWHQNKGFRHRNQRRLRGHYYKRHNRGAAVAAGIAGLIIGGAISASRRDYGNRWERCDAAYRTFRWSDGTYIPELGAPRVLCPYLRR